MDAERAVSCWLVHSVDTLVIKAYTRSNGHLQKADAIITDQSDTPLVMRYADCVPLLLYDSVKRVIGLGHAGWRGTVKGMAASMVRKMRETYDCKPQDIEVVIGPAISRRNYRVGEEVVAQADAYFGVSAGVVWRDPVDCAPYFDLWAQTGWTWSGAALPTSRCSISAPTRIPKTSILIVRKTARRAALAW